MLKFLFPNFRAPNNFKKEEENKIDENKEKE